MAVLAGPADRGQLSTTSDAGPVLLTGSPCSRDRWLIFSPNRTGVPALLTARVVQACPPGGPGRIGRGHVEMDANSAVLQFAVAPGMAARAARSCPRGRPLPARPHSTLIYLALIGVLALQATAVLARCARQ